MGYLERITQVDIKLLPMYTLKQVAIAFEISECRYNYWYLPILEFQFAISPYFERLNASIIGEFRKVK